MSPRTARSATRLANPPASPFDTLNVGDLIHIDIQKTKVRGLPARVTAIYLDRIEFQYTAEAEVFAGVRSFVYTGRKGKH